MNTTESEKSGNALRWSLVAIVIFHLAINMVHGAAHIHVPVELTESQELFVGLVVLLLPLVGTGLLWTRWKKTASWLITLTMLGSLLFGFANHFVLESSDNVTSVPVHAWRPAFISSAGLLAISESIGTVLGILAIQKWRRS